MKLRTIITAILAVSAVGMSAQRLQPTWNKPVGLQHKLQLSTDDINALAKLQHKKAPNASTVVRGSINRSKISRAASRIAPARAAYEAADTLFYDSFEQWDNTWGYYNTSNWTRYSICSDYISESNGECPTWMVWETDGYYTPYATDGKNLAVIMNGYNVFNADSTKIISPAPEQNEWLVSKLITTRIAKTTYLTFDIAYIPYTFHYFETFENGVYDSFVDKNLLAYDVEVLISKGQRVASNNESVYTKVWNASSEVDPLFANVNSGDEISSNKELMSYRWQHIEIPLSDFEGANIRVAFRYKGKNGGTILIDNVRVSDLLPIAKYDVPAGSFLYGISMDGYGDTEAPICLVPANTETKWKSESNPDSKTFEWATWNWGDKSMGVEETQNSVLTYGESVVASGNVAEAYMPYPTLTTGANNGRSNSFKRNGFVKFGGNTVVSTGNIMKQFGATNIDLTKELWSPEVNGNYAFGAPSAQFWSSFFDLNSSSFTGKVCGIGNLFEQPAAPYVVSTIWIPLYKFSALSNTVRFNCEIYRARINEDGSFEITSELIADASCTAKDVKDSKQSSDAPYNLVFNFDKELVINEPVFIYVNGFENKNLVTIAPYSQALGHDSGNNYAFVSMQTKSGSYSIQSVTNMLTNADGIGNAASSFLMCMNAIFPYLYSTDGNEFEAPKEGGDKTFNIDTYFAPQDWIVSTPEWVKCETIMNEEDSKASIKITADPLPAGLSGRSGEVKISSTGNVLTIDIKQGDSSAMQGDMDGDGTISISDITLLIDTYLNDRQEAAGDMNGDGAITIADITILINTFLSAE